MLKAKVELVTKQSKKTGNNYTALEISFENGYRKMVFLDNAEIYMLTSLDSVSN